MTPTIPHDHIDPDRIHDAADSRYSCPYCEYTYWGPPAPLGRSPRHTLPGVEKCTHLQGIWRPTEDNAAVLEELLGDAGVLVTDWESSLNPSGAAVAVFAPEEAAAQPAAQATLSTS